MRAIAALLLTLSACAAPQLPPALPDERRWPSEAPGFATPEQLRPMLPDLAPMWPPVLQPVALEPPVTLNAKTTKRQRPERPDTIMRDANREALITPGRTGYFGGSAIQRYVYQPGRVYLVVSSPSHPTTILLPPGERLASGPVIDRTEGEGWDVGIAEMPAEGDRVEALWIRPYKAGLESTLPLLTLGGRAYFLRLKSQETLGMVAVTWELPTVQVLPRDSTEKPERPRQEQPTSLRAPHVALDRLHNAYRIDIVGKHTPPWVPVTVFDDGQRSYIRFKEPALTYTSAPALFGVSSDQNPSLIEFSTFSDGKGLWYVVEGLFPEMRLRGIDNLEVKITRIPTP